MLYVIVPLQKLNEENKSRLQKKVEGLELPTYNHEESGVYFIFSNSAMSTKDIAEKVGFSGPANRGGHVGTGIVCAVRSNYGYSDRALWDWMEKYGV